MALSHDDKLAGMYTRDRTHDGRYIVAVRSTRIYCLPSCPARKPHAANVRFLSGPDAARAAGFRACLRCRPDDFYAGVDHRLDELARAVATLRQAPASVASVADLAALAGCGPTQLTERVREHYHLTPATLIARARVAHAAEQLRRGVAVAAAGYDAGFDSSTAYYQNLRRYLGLSPGEYQRLARRGGRARRTLEFSVRLPAHFEAGPVCQLLSRDRSAASEQVTRVSTGSGARRMRLLKGIAADGRRATLELTLGQREAHARIHGEVAGAAMATTAHEAVVRLLGFASEATTLRKRLKGDDALTPMIMARPGLRVPLMVSPFEALTWAVLGQQVNLAFAGALRATLIRLAWGLPEDADAILLPHPSADAVAALEPRDLRARRFSRSKAEWLVALATAVSNGELALDKLAGEPAGSAREVLLARKGIGAWTADYIMLRGFGFNDAVPAADAGLTRALQTALALAQRPEATAVHAALAPYSPCRSVVCQHLWHSLASGPPAQAAGKTAGDRYRGEHA
jgi:AraC family transcriptional regulator of adaptative response / DNA-3-methyladenine glycosylase II